MWKSTIVIARVRGIEIGINWTWIFIFALIVWSLASSAFPSIAKDLPTAAYWVMAVIAALLFFTSLILHELGHATQALREGMRIEGITLWLFGGVAKFSGMFPSAGAEFRVAIAGPLVTLAIAILTGAIAAIPGEPDSVSAVAYWLSLINISLLVFNMLPAFPMDGGRVLRSALWQKFDDFSRATEIAGTTGRLFGQLFIFGGIALALLARVPGGLWIALIGWFVVGAGQAEVQMARVRTSFKGMTVSDLMVKEPKTVPTEMTVERFEADVLPVSRFRAYPVVDQRGETIGLLRSQTATQTPRGDWRRVTMGDCMVPLEKALAVDSQKDLGEASIELMQTEPGRALVVENGRLHGLLSITDIVRWLEILKRK